MSTPFLRRINIHKHLKDAINYAWVMESKLFEQQEKPDLLIPDGCPEVIFVLKGTYQKQLLQNNTDRQVVDRSVAVGIQINSLLVKRAGKVRLIGIKFKPLGFYRFFGEKGAKMLNRTINLSDFGEQQLIELDQQLANCYNISECSKILNEALLQFAMKEPSVSLNITAACINAIIKAKGDVNLSAMANEHYKSLRQIQRYFQQYIGISPKSFAKLIRFKALYKETVIADQSSNHFLDYGYFDQNHFIKEFKAYLGITPKQARERHFQQKNEIARLSRR